jgi:hypothetical protein
MYRTIEQIGIMPTTNNRTEYILSNRYPLNVPRDIGGISRIQNVATVPGDLVLDKWSPEDTKSYWHPWNSNSPVLTPLVPLSPHFSTSRDQIQVRGIPKVSSVSDVPKSQGVCSHNSCGNSDIANILDPKFNLREVCKHSALLEDHLFQKNKRCDDCIKKHLLTIEAFLEEAITLDKDNKLTGTIETILQSFRVASGAFVKHKDYLKLAQSLRDIRKNLMSSSGLFECVYSG